MRIESDGFVAGLATLGNGNRVRQIWDFGEAAKCHLVSTVNEQKGNGYHDAGDEGGGDPDFALAIAEGHDDAQCCGEDQANGCGEHEIAEWPSGFRTGVWEMLKLMDF